MTHNKSKIIIKPYELDLIASFLDSGVSLDSVFRYLFQHKGGRVQDQLAHILDIIVSGRSYTDVFSCTQLHKDDLYMHLIDASQTNGCIPIGLRDISLHMKKVAEQRQMLAQIFAYPIIVSLVLICLFLFMFIFVVPQLRPLIQASAQDVPTLTTLLVYISNTINNHGVTISILSLVSLCFFIYTFSTRAARNIVSDTCIKMGWVGKLYQLYILERVSLILYYYTKAGLDIQTTFDKASSLVFLPNVYRKRFKDISHRLSLGDSLVKVVTNDVYIPYVWGVYIKIAENGSSYESAFLNISEIHGAEIKKWTGYIHKLSEPILMIIIGMVVGLFAYAILVPMYGLIQTIQ